MKRLITNTLTGILLLGVTVSTQSCIFGDSIEYIYGTEWQSDEDPFGQTEITGIAISFRCESDITLSTDAGQQRIISDYECNAEKASFPDLTIPAGTTSITLTTARRKGTELALTWHLTGDSTPNTTHLRIIQDNN